MLNAEKNLRKKKNDIWDVGLYKYKNIYTFCLIE